MIKFSFGKNQNEAFYFYQDVSTTVGGTISFVYIFKKKISAELADLANQNNENALTHQ